MKNSFPTLLLILVISLSPKLGMAKDVNVLDYGAVNDGKTLTTKALQSAIDAAGNAGGGTVTLPPGTYYTGTIYLRNNTYLNLQGGATILGSTNIADYPLQASRWESPNNLRHLVCAQNNHHVGIIGTGTIDGNGPAFWEPIQPMPDWIVGKPIRIPRYVEFTNCTDVLIRDVTLTNAPEWTLHLFGCQRVTVDNIRIENHLFGPNNDGIDISGCQDVRISNCYIKTCDDGICLKTLPENKACERITVNNCIIETSCAALKIGNESFHDFRQIAFSNCVVSRSSRAIGIYAEDGGDVEDVVISNIVLDNNAPLILNRPIHISNFRKGTKAGIISHILLQNIICRTNGRVLITAEPGSIIRDVSIAGLRMTYPFIEDPYTLSDSARSAQYSPRNKNARKQRAAIVAEGVEQLTIRDLKIEWPAGPVPSAWRQPVKIENGWKYRTIRPKYDRPQECTFQVLWGNNLRDADLHLDGVTSSDTKLKPYTLENSTYRLVK